jgi:hypothetical protein
VLRRVETDEGRTDELFSRNFKWELSPLLYSAERGDTMFDFTEITVFTVASRAYLAFAATLGEHVAIYMRTQRWLSADLGPSGAAPQSVWPAGPCQ